MHFFIVIEYGCNSTPGDLLFPNSKLFACYMDAYAYFEDISQANGLDHLYVNKFYDPSSTGDEYIIIEDRRSDYYAKRPNGVIIARHGVS